MTESLTSALETLKRTCLRCQHVWMLREAVEPLRCPRCGSPYWNKDGRKPKIREGFVYFATSGPFVKIGFSNDPAKRLGSLSLGKIPKELPSPLRFSDLMWCAASSADEGKVHRVFSSYCAVGEWFRIEGAVKKFIDGVRIADDRDVFFRNWLVENSKTLAKA